MPVSCKVVRTTWQRYFAIAGCSGGMTASVGTTSRWSIGGASPIGQAPAARRSSALSSIRRAWMIATSLLDRCSFVRSTIGPMLIW